MLKTIQEAKQELTEILIESVPTLFLGAGFSVGAESSSSTMVGSDLKEYIFDNLIKDKIDSDDYDEVKGYNLRRLCDQVYSIYKGKKELTTLLTNCYKNTNPTGKEFHLKLNKYPWKKIYTVNIDDLVENIFKKNGIELLVQNEKRLKYVRNGITELYKLHGCVNNEKEGYIFSEEEYTELITKRLDAKLNSFTMEIQNSNIIFIGASMDEPDINYYLTVYNDAGCKYRNNKLIFIDYKPSRYLKDRAEKLGAIIIKAKTEEFLDMLEEINYSPTTYEKAKIELNYNGIYRLTDLSKMYTKPYESKLYEGEFCKWQDVNEKWTFENSNYLKAIHELEMLLAKGNQINCFSIYGTVFSGKSCLLKQIGYYLFNKNYDVIEYVGRFLNKNSIVRYINDCPNQKFALLIDGGSYYYEQIEDLFKIVIGTKKLIIVTASREYYHNKKKYYLEGNSYCDFYQNNLFHRGDPEIIRKTLDDKAYLSYMASLSEPQQIAEISRQKSMINLIVKLTYRDVIRKIKQSYQKAFERFTELEKKLLTELAIFDTADIEFYPRELFTERYGQYIEIEDEITLGRMRIIDYIRMNKNGFSLRNEIMNEYIIANRKKEIKDILISILHFLSKLIVENSNNTWYIIFQCLLKEDALKSKLNLANKDIKDIYFSVKEEYREISYYWLQLGLFQQSMGDFISAYNYLERSASIRPKSYKIQHAIARNYLRHSNSTQNLEEALTLFKKGEKKMKELIESKEYAKEKAKSFSVNSFIVEKIKFIERFNLQVSNSEIKYMKCALDSIKGNPDPYMQRLYGKFYVFLEKHDKLDLIKFDIDSPYIKYIGKKNDLYMDDDVVDPVVEAIN